VYHGRAEEGHDVITDVFIDGSPKGMYYSIYTFKKLL
jgi:hypothetical protein